ncbi:MAG: FtsX-like permease family protein [Patescibacteria group bacterium]|jgi:putative ABC transport system permease protein
MKYELKIPFFLAFRQITRGSKWTFFLIIFLMAAAFINLVFVSSLFKGIIKGSNEQVINMYSGHIMIKPNSGKDVFENRNNVIEKIGQIPGVESVTTQFEIGANLAFNEKNGNWIVNAVNPEQEIKVTKIFDNMIAGEYLKSDDQNGIIIGKQIAGGDVAELDAFSLHAEVGDVIKANINGIEKEFVVRGIFNSKYMTVDNTAFITYAGLDSIFPSFVDQANTALVRLNEAGDEQAVIEAIKESGIHGTYYTWEDAAGIMNSVTTSFLSIDFILSLVATLIAAVTIFIVVYIDISNKRQQIGILRAIGVKPYIIRSAYVIISSIYSVIGVGLGAALFFGAIMPYFIAHPFVLPIVDATLAIEPADFIFRMESIIIVSILVSLIPSFMVTRIKLLNAIWGK